MSRRSYAQYCMLTRALDIVGERWTLLIVRDLLMGPRRFTDLQAGLPGIGTNLLSARLKMLADAGVVERTVVPPARATVWALTALGQDLEEPILALAGWGRRVMGTPKDGELRRDAWLFLALRRFYYPDAIGDLTATVVFEIGEERLFVRCERGALTTGEGVPVGADATVRATSADVRALIFGGDLDALSAQGRVEVDGDREVLASVLAAFG